MDDKERKPVVARRTYKLTFMRVKDVNLRGRDLQRERIQDALKSYHFVRPLLLFDNDITFKASIDTVHEKDFLDVLSSDGLYDFSRSSLLSASFSIFILPYRFSKSEITEKFNTVRDNWKYYGQSVFCAYRHRLARCENEQARTSGRNDRRRLFG